MLENWGRCELVASSMEDRTSALRALVSELQRAPLATCVLFLDPACLLLAAAVLGGFLRSYPPNTVPEICK